MPKWYGDVKAFRKAIWKQVPTTIKRSTSFKQMIQLWVFFFPEGIIQMKYKAMWHSLEPLLIVLNIVCTCPAPDPSSLASQFCFGVHSLRCMQSFSNATEKLACSSLKGKWPKLGQTLSDICILERHNLRKLWSWSIPQTKTFQCPLVPIT